MSTKVRARIMVLPDGSISGQLQGSLPPGEHFVEIATESEIEAAMAEWEKSFPYAVSGGWREGVSTRREDIY